MTQSRGVVRVHRRFDCGRRSPRQGRSALFPFGFHLDPPPGSGELRLGFRARRISFARYRGGSLARSQSSIIGILFG